MRRPLLLVAAHLSSRLVTLPLLAFQQPLIIDPIVWMDRIGTLGLARALPEYPWPAVVLLGTPMRLGVQLVPYYFLVLIGFLLLVDALLVWLLWRAGGRAMTPGLRLWLLAFPAIGPLLVTRFDLLPAALMGASLLALHARRSATAGACAALGCGLKVWPLLGVPALFVPGEASGRARLLGGLAVTGGLLALATLAAAGAERLWSPLGTQLGRGLQFEAFAALPFLWLRFFDGGGSWTLQAMASCNCHEVAGPGAATALQAANAAGLLGIALLAWAHWRALALPAALRDAALAALLACLSVLVVVATSRVFSPQYMIWIAVMVATLGVLPGQAVGRAEVLLMLAACVLTQIVYPAGLLALMQPSHPGQPGALLALTLRDALVIVLAMRLAARLWRATAPARAAPEPA